MFLATEEHVFKAKFFRSSLDVEYEFLKDNGNNIIVKYSLSYEVENIGREFATYQVLTLVEKRADHVGVSFSDGVQLGLLRITVDGQDVAPEEIEQARNAIPDDDDFVTSSYPIQLNPGERRRVQVVHVLEKGLRDSELWRSLIPCAGITFRLRWNPDSNLVFRAEPVHPAGKFDSIHRDENSLIATLGQPFFPHNGIHFWWSSKGGPS